jgi:hypothetical protein
MSNRHKDYRMSIRIVIAGVALLAQLAVAAGTANAGVGMNHEASRDDQRQHCAGDGRILVDRLDYTFCEDKLAASATSA